jgi:drug/metabolite transporter (DMT)-like permease
MSSDVTFVSRAALVVLMLVVASFFRALVGPGKRRGRIMLAGTLGGISFGVLVASLVSQWLNNDVLGVCAFLGMVLGWGVCWLFARRIPREAN